MLAGEKQVMVNAKKFTFDFFFFENCVARVQPESEGNAATHNEFLVTINILPKTLLDSQSPVWKLELLV